MVRWRRWGSHNNFFRSCSPWKFWYFFDSNQLFDAGHQDSTTTTNNLCSQNIETGLPISTQATTFRTLKPATQIQQPSNRGTITNYYKMSMPPANSSNKNATAASNTVANNTSFQLGTDIFVKQGKAWHAAKFMEYIEKDNSILAKVQYVTSSKVEEVELHCLQCMVKEGEGGNLNVLHAPQLPLITKIWHLLLHQISFLKLHHLQTCK
jgi:hypothetical protein